MKNFLRTLHPSRLLQTRTMSQMLCCRPESRGIMVALRGLSCLCPPVFRWERWKCMRSVNFNRGWCLGRLLERCAKNKCRRTLNTSGLYVDRFEDRGIIIVLFFFVTNTCCSCDFIHDKQEFLSQFKWVFLPFPDQGWYCFYLCWCIWWEQI